MMTVYCWLRNDNSWYCWYLLIITDHTRWEVTIVTYSSTVRAPLGPKMCVDLDVFHSNIQMQRGPNHPLNSSLMTEASHWVMHTIHLLQKKQYPTNQTKGHSTAKCLRFKLFFTNESTTLVVKNMCVSVCVSPFRLLMHHINTKLVI
jgi:hypothetical protein